MRVIQRRSEINVTPFVDVMLVLLIIFMVTAPLMQQGIDVDLPETTTQQLRVQDEPLVLTIDKEGKYHLGRREVSKADLSEKLEAIFEGRDSKEILCGPMRMSLIASSSKRWPPLGRPARPNWGW